MNSQHSSRFDSGACFVGQQGVHEVELVRFANLCMTVLPVLNEDEDEIEIENGRKFVQTDSGDREVVKC